MLRLRSSLHTTVRECRQSELSEVFDLGLSVRGKRVAATNWSLFSSRQILREHGGKIRIESYPNRGTTAYVSLPC